MIESKVSVIISVFNGERFLSQAVESVLNQTHDNLEVVIIDDGSTDHSEEIALGLAVDRRVKNFKQNNGGVATARNLGIAHATGDYVAFLDQDDLWAPRKLEYQLALFQSNDDIALVHGNIEFIDTVGKFMVLPKWAWVKPIASYCIKELFIGNNIATLTTLIRKTCFDEVGIFRQKFAPADDWDMWLRLGVKYPFGFIPEVLGYYRIHDANESRKLLPMQSAKTRVVEQFITAYPPIVRLLGRGTVRQVLYNCYRETANISMREREHLLPHLFWRKAISVKPWAVEAYRGIVWSALPEHHRSTINWYMGRIISMWNRQ